MQRTFNSSEMPCTRSNNGTLLALIGVLSFGKVEYEEMGVRVMTRYVEQLSPRGYLMPHAVADTHALI